MTKKLNNILISNDDGYESVGLKVLLNIAEQLADNVLIVSPKINQSAKSKSITIKQNINFMAGTVQGGTSSILIRATTSADVGTANIDFDNTFGPSDSLILTAIYHASS